MTRKAPSPLPAVRKGQGKEFISRAEFEQRYRGLFVDPAFRPADAKIDELLGVAWNAYQEARKSPVTRTAGPGFADPEYELSVEWLATRAAIEAAQVQQADNSNRARVLLVCAAARNDKTCPGEMSKSFRLLQTARDALEARQIEVDVLDLSELTSEYKKVIYPCKACVSTAMPLCHWPCSCYPNHALGQTGDWMNELYPRWVAAHGIMIITPVYWYQSPSVLKLMIDRLVCADGGNPDPSSTHGKKADEAKALELAGWNYPRHLAGRAFSVIVHGDSAGIDGLRRSLADWLEDMGLVQAGKAASFDRFIDYYGSYATSHDALDKDDALREEVRNAARSLANQIARSRSGLPAVDEGLSDPRPK
jgi:multimeric flavodoxin WrbA